MPSRILWSLLLSFGIIVSASLSLYGQSTYGSIAGVGHRYFRSRGYGRQCDA